MPRYTRAWIPGGTFFFTVALLERRRRLLTEHIDLLRAAFRQVKQKRPFEIEAIAVLPDHFHCVWTMSPDDTDYSTRIRLIKTLFCRAIPASESLSARRVVKGERGIWQRRFWEHAIRDEYDLQRHVDYTHYNPVKHGHARSASEWPYSTFHRYVADGIYAPDWAAPPETVDDDRE